MSDIDFILIEEYDNDRNIFIKDFQYYMSKIMKSDRITKFSLKKYVSKVTFVPLNIKNEDGYVTLAKHTFGKRKDQFNFIGGGTNIEEEEWDYKSENDKMFIVAKSLFDEVYEEFGVMLNWENFNKSLIDIKRAGLFLLFYVNIVNINPEFWKNMQEDRKNIQNLSKKYTEIDEIKDYNLNFIKNEYERLKDPETNKITFYVKDEIIEVSRYVISMTKHMKDMINKIKVNENLYSTDVKNFKSIPLKRIYYKSKKNV
jgi:hypothetical protein